jgi:DNA-binding SARP family transcriptional activator
VDFGAHGSRLGAVVAIRLLGPFGAQVAGRPVDLGGPRQRAVLALLLVARGEVVSVDRLIEDLWRGEPPPRATGALQAYVSHLRRALEPDREPRSPARVLVSSPPGYRVILDPDDVDGWRFEAMLARAATAPDRFAALALIQDAMALWQGPALAEFAAEPWAAPEAARLEELRIVGRERLVGARIRCGAVAEAVVDAEALVRDAPLREEGWRLLATAHYASGRQADALATLRRARELLADELGIDPGPRLAELEQAVLQQAVALPDQPARLPAGPPASAPRPRGPGIAFVGRTAELALLHTSAGSAAPGRAAVALIAGDAGSGKSALLGRFRDELAEAGWRCASGRCPESGGGSPAWAWAEVVRALAAEHAPEPALAEHLAPLLSDAPEPDGGADALRGRFRLHRAVGAWLSQLADRPLLVVLDDVHRADAETRALLASLLDQQLRGPVLFAVAYRPESDEGLEDLLATAAAHAPTRIRLTGLTRDETGELIGSVLTAAPPATLVDALAERTDGNPFYVLESARLLASEGELVATSQVPAGVADVLRRRFARLPEETVSVLRLAAVLGRDVDVALLLRSAEVDEATVLDALEAGVISGLLLEPAPGTLRFAHVLVRETLYSGVPQLRRARWHARVAEAVAELYPGDLSALAHHAVHAATPTTADRAIGYCVAAAELAERRYAYDAAAELYRQALTCLDLVRDAAPARRVDLLARRTRMLVLGNATVPARDVLTEAIDAAGASGDDRLLVTAVLGWNVPSPWTNRPYGQVDTALVSVVERVLRTVELSPAERSLLLCTLARASSFSDDPRTEAAAVEALRAARADGRPELVANALMTQSEVYQADVHPLEREALRIELAELAERHDLVVFRLLAHILAVQSANVRLAWDEARAQAERARQMAIAYQVGQALVVATSIDAMHAHVAGDLVRAEELYRQAYEDQARMGGVDARSQLFLGRLTLRATEGRLPEMTDELRWLFANGVSAVGDPLALALAEQGELDEARAVLAGLPPRPIDYLWQLFLTTRALAVALAGDRDRAAELYPTLLPYRGQVAGAGTTGYVFTPVARALGHLAAVLDRPADARRHFTEAAEVARRCGSAPWLAQVDADRAALALVD